MFSSQVDVAERITRVIVPICLLLCAGVLTASTQTVEVYVTKSKSDSTKDSGLAGPVTIQETVTY